MQTTMRVFSVESLNRKSLPERINIPEIPCNFKRLEICSRNP